MIPLNEVSKTEVENRMMIVREWEEGERGEDVQWVWSYSYTRWINQICVDIVAPIVNNVELDT